MPCATMNTTYNVQGKKVTALTDKFNAILSPHICSLIGAEDWLIGLFIYQTVIGYSDGS